MEGMAEVVVVGGTMMAARGTETGIVIEIGIGIGRGVGKGYGNGIERGVEVRSEIARGSELGMKGIETEMFPGAATKEGDSAFLPEASAATRGKELEKKKCRNTISWPVHLDETTTLLFCVLLSSSRAGCLYLSSCMEKWEIGLFLRGWHATLQIRAL